MSKPRTKSRPKMSERAREMRRWIMHEELGQAREVARSYFGLTITVDDCLNLDRDEARELRDLVARLEFPIEAPPPDYASRLEAEAFAEQVVALDPPSTLPAANRARLREEVEAHAEQVRQLGRTPTRTEWQRIRAGVPASSFVVREAGKTFDPTNLTEEEHVRLRELLEKASGRTGYFAEIAAKARIRGLAARAESAGGRTRSAQPLAGGVTLPQRVFDDVCPKASLEEFGDIPDPEKKFLLPHDVAVLWSVLAIMQTGRVPLGAPTRLETDEDGDPVVVTEGPPLGHRSEELPDRDPVIGNAWIDSLQRLGANTKWLDVNLSDGIYRIKVGPRGRKYGLGDGQPTVSAAAVKVKA